MARRISAPIDVDVDTGGVNRMEAATDGLNKALQQLRQTASETFSAKSAVQYAKATTGALNKVQKSVQGVKRSLADFDELQRLGSQKTSSSSAAKKTGTQLLLEMLQNYDSSRALVTLNLVSGAVEKLNTQVQVSLARMQLLDARLNAQALAVGVNTAAWQANAVARMLCITAQQLLTSEVTGWNSICTTSTAATLTLKTALSALQEQQKQVLTGFTLLRTGCEAVVLVWQRLGLSGQQMCGTLRASLQSIGLSLQKLFSPEVLAGLQAGFDSAGKVFISGFTQLLLAVNDGFLPLWRQAWHSTAMAFQTAMGAMPGNLKQIANCAISVFNGMLSGIAGGYNDLISNMNRQRMIMAVTTGVSAKMLPGISVPQIPHLAEGAVLPANKPFMAVVGDQKRGVNVESPLSTIQEAVALVMEDQTSAIMAGLEASVEVQKAILEAVLGISIGDDVIGQASQRYMQKMAIMRGGQM